MIICTYEQITSIFTFIGEYTAGKPLICYKSPLTVNNSLDGYHYVYRLGSETCVLLKLDRTLPHSATISFNATLTLVLKTQSHPDTANSRNDQTQPCAITIKR